MNRSVCKSILKLFVFLVCAGLSALPGAGVIFTVDDKGNADFSTIQEAINSSNNGDSILVNPGIYNENIKIDREISLVSSGKAINTFINSNDTETDILYVTADNVFIDGFTIVGFMDEGRSISEDEAQDPAGILLDGASGCRVLNSTFLLNDFGILANESDNLLLQNNFVVLNYYGIGLVNLSGCTLSDNIVERSDSNVGIVNSSDNILLNNTFTGSSNISLFLNRCNNTLLKNNEISNNVLTGISIYESENNTLVDNMVEKSNLGIHITNSSGNHLYGNWLENRINAIDDGMNFWNDTTGNYWSDYVGEDANMDGVGDKSYIVNESTGSIDYIPIV